MNSCTMVSVWANEGKAGCLICLSYQKNVLGKTGIVSFISISISEIITRCQQTPIILTSNFLPRMILNRSAAH